MVAINLIPGPRRICKTCNRRLPHDAFYRAKGCKDGIRPECKRCTLDKQAKHYQENREDKIERQKRYYQANRERVLEYQRSRQDDPVYQHNRRQIWLKNRKAQRKRRRANPIHNLTDRVRVRLANTFRAKGLKKNTPAFGRLGYTPQELYQHLTQYLGRPCELCGFMLTRGNAEIDHIVLLATAHTEDDIWRLNALSNLRLICQDCNQRRPKK